MFAENCVISGIHCLVFFLIFSHFLRIRASPHHRSEAQTRKEWQNGFQRNTKLLKQLQHEVQNYVFLYVHLSICKLIEGSRLHQGAALKIYISNKINIHIYIYIYRYWRRMCGVHTCVHACMHACVRACLCVRASVHASRSRPNLP